MMIAAEERESRATPNQLSLRSAAQGWQHHHADLDEDQGQAEEEQADAEVKVIEAPNSLAKKLCGCVFGDASKHHKVHMARFNLAEDFRFLCIVAAISVVNLEVLALEVDLKCYSKWCPDGQALWMILDNFFTIIFILEIILRIVDEGPKRYIQGTQDPSGAISFSWMHCLDVLIVLGRAVDVWFLSQVGIQNTGLKQISAFRVAHLCPCIKHLRLVRQFRELWLAVAAVAETGKTILWVAVMLFLVIWVFAIVFTMLIGQASPENFDYSHSTWGLSDYWGTVPKSAFTLFQVLTGDTWAGTVAWPVIVYSNAMMIFFVFFIWIAFMMLYNTITGAVVEAILSSSKANEEKASKERQRTEAKVMESLRQIFTDASKDGSGVLDRRDLHSTLQQKRVRERMHMLDIPSKDLDVLFTLMDENGTGTIQTDMFFRGCSRLRGPAMASDLHHMSVDLERNLTWCRANFDSMQETNDKLSKLLDHADTVDIDIVRGDADDKDPVLKARRARERVSKGDFYRTGQSKEHPVTMDTEWEIFNGISRQGSKGSKGSRSLLRRGSKTFAASIASNVVEKRDLSKIKEESCPAPPALPPHLAHLEVAAATTSGAMVMLKNKRSITMKTQATYLWPA